MKVWVVKFKGSVYDDEHNFPDEQLLEIFDSEEKAKKYTEEIQKENEEMDNMIYDKVEYYVDRYEVK